MLENPRIRTCGLRLRRPIKDVRTTPHDAASARNDSEPSVGEDRTQPHITARNSPKFGATLGDASERAPGGFLDEPVLTVRGVAERLRVSTATVYALCRRGELAHHRVSNAIRIPERALADYLTGASSSTAWPSGTGPERGSR